MDLLVLEENSQEDPSITQKYRFPECLSVCLTDLFVSQSLLKNCSSVPTSKLIEKCM